MEKIVEKEQERDSSNFITYYNLAVGTCVVSLFTLLSLLVFVPLMYFRSGYEQSVMMEKAAKFKEDSNRIWAYFEKLETGKEGVVIGAPSNAIFFSRKARSDVWDKHVCKGCSQLSCSGGPPGPPGPPGEDAPPGNPGMPGKSGEDGFDVELEPEGDMPCVICPGGPPGPRGPQGERGMGGTPGEPGGKGEPGKPGINGPAGTFGSPGLQGKKGFLGVKGQSGDMVVAGVGIRGPKGPLGPAGPKGPRGQPGKGSRAAGMPGKPGLMGPPGSPGSQGNTGENGPIGPPGEPGQPAAYCPSDCGVSKIMASIPEMKSQAPSAGYGPSGAEKKSYNKAVDGGQSQSVIQSESTYDDELIE